MDILTQIITLFLGLFSTYIVFDFMSQFGRNLYYKKYFYVIGYILYTASIVVAEVLFHSGILILFVSILSTVLAGHFLYNDKKIYILYYSIYIVVLASFQIASSIIFQIIFSYANVNFYSQNIQAITVSIITQFVNLSASRLFIVFYKRKNIDMITPVQYLNFLVLPVFSVFYIITLLMYIETSLSIEDIVILLVNIISIIILNMFVTNVFESVSKNNHLKNKIMLYEEQSKMQYEYYSSLEKKYNNSRKIIHDIKNHLNTIEDLCKSQDSEKAENYTKDMYKIFDKLSQKYYTSNKVLNIIINDKVQKACAFGITLDSKIGDVKLNFIKDIDLTTIFANILDNAINGAKDSKDDKMIWLKIDKFNEFIVINLVNSDSCLKPVKIDKGTGLQNVNMALNKYEGNMRIECKCKKFKVNIVIPVPI